MRLRGLVLSLCLALASLPAAAQFYNWGSEPVGARWYQLKTQDYKVIYPEGLDSLARVYASLLEQVKEPLSVTSGYRPNQMYRKQLPVVLHPWDLYSNGMVAWTPKRMELFTTPSAQAPLPHPWAEHLTIHESRHVAQMQYVAEKPYRFWNVLLGQLSAGPSPRSTAARPSTRAMPWRRRRNFPLPAAGAAPHSWSISGWRSRRATSATGGAGATAR